MPDAARPRPSRRQGGRPRPPGRRPWQADLRPPPHAPRIQPPGGERRPTQSRYTRGNARGFVGGRVGALRGLRRPGRSAAAPAGGRDRAGGRRGVEARGARRGRRCDHGRHGAGSCREAPRRGNPGRRRLPGGGSRVPGRVLESPRRPRSQAPAALPGGDRRALQGARPADAARRTAHDARGDRSDARSRGRVLGRRARSRGRAGVRQRRDARDRRRAREGGRALRRRPPRGGAGDVREGHGRSRDADRQDRRRGSRGAGARVPRRGGERRRRDAGPGRQEAAPAGAARGAGARRGPARSRRARLPPLDRARDRGRAARREGAAARRGGGGGEVRPRRSAEGAPRVDEVRRGGERPVPRRPREDRGGRRAARGGSGGRVRGVRGRGRLVPGRARGEPGGASRAGRGTAPEEGAAPSAPRPPRHQEDGGSRAARAGVASLPPGRRRPLVVLRLHPARSARDAARGRREPALRPGRHGPRPPLLPRGGLRRSRRRGQGLLQHQRRARAQVAPVGAGRRRGLRHAGDDVLHVQPRDRGPRDVRGGPPQQGPRAEEVGGDRGAVHRARAQQGPRVALRAEGRQERHLGDRLVRGGARRGAGGRDRRGRRRVAGRARVGRFDDRREGPRRLQRQGRHAEPPREGESRASRRGGASP